MLRAAMTSTVAKKLLSEVHYCTISASSKGSPHSGQNFGGLRGSSGCQPHLSHAYCGAPVGFLAPHSAQNFPLFTAPHAHVQPSFEASGFLAPHSGQNFPVADAPHAGHFHPVAGSGFLAPHSGQNLPVAAAPHAHVHPAAAGAGLLGGGVC